MAYLAAGAPAIVLAGREYGSGSSRDWAAKGTRLLGIRAVIAESYERIHRSNLVGMGVLPLQFLPGESAASPGPHRPRGLHDRRPRRRARARGRGSRSSRSPTRPTAAGERRFEVECRLDGPIEVDYYRQGGILPAVLRRIARESGAA